MKKQKTNIEELAFRFRKSLLNNYTAKLHMQNHHSLMHMITDEEAYANFNYDQWCKSLFKDTDSLICELERYYEEFISFNEEALKEPYTRSSFIDLIDINTLVNDVLSGWYSFFDTDESRAIFEVKRQSLFYVKKYLKTIKFKNDCETEDEIIDVILGSIFSQLDDNEIKGMINLITDDTYECNYDAYIRIKEAANEYTDREIGSKIDK